MGAKCKAMGFLNDLVGGSFFTPPSSLALFNVNMITNTLFHSNSSSKYLHPRSNSHLDSEMNVEDAFVDSFHRMLRTRPLPPVVTFNQLLGGFSLWGRLLKQKNAFAKWSKDGCKPNVVIYTTLLDGNCKMEHGVAAIQLLKKMEKEHNIMPDIVSYSTIIDGLCKEGLVDRALDLFLKMTRKDVAPDVVTP